MTRTYIADPSEAPDSVEVHEGDQGGYYYETTDGEETSEEDSETTTDEDVETTVEVVNDITGDETTEDEVEEAVEEEMKNKDRVYIEDPSEAPEDANVEEGERGGYYYEQGGSSGDVTEEAINAIEEGFEQGMSAEEITEALMDTEDEPKGIVESLVDGFGRIMEGAGIQIEASEETGDIDLEK